MKYIFLIIFTIFFIISCKTNYPEVGKDNLIFINYYNFYDDNEIVNTDSLILFKTFRNDSVFFEYSRFRDTSSIYSFSKSTYDNSLIKVCNEYLCPLLSSRNISVNGKNHIIRQYYYDDKKNIDEETIFFFNDNYGVLAEYSIKWSYFFSSIKYDEVSQILFDSIINNKEDLKRYIKR
ncbi:MAG: hypothetical protein LBQ22_00670 [Bacteroidales bacterium]|jgi:hypothetical protein|nr:hypothetical protein [Bacteroidales bacterium]